MKTLVKVILICAGIAGLAGCVKDDNESGYYSSSYSPNPATTGYNRDYQQPRRNGYSSSQVNPQQPVNNSYSSSSSRTQYSRSGSGYQSSGSVGSNGYSSSGYSS